MATLDEVLPQKDRRCFGVDPEIFVGPDGEGTPDRVFREQEAKSICSRCMLINPCLRWALEHGESGVWGGTNDDERRRIRSGRPRKIKDPEGMTPQERRRADRVKIAKKLKANGVTLDDIAAEIGVTLDTVYTYVRESQAMTPQEQRRADRVEIARQLKAKGLALNEIAAEIGVSLGTIYGYIRDGDLQNDRGNGHGEAKASSDQGEAIQAEKSRSSYPIGKASSILGE